MRSILSGIVTFRPASSTTCLVSSASDVVSEEGNGGRPEHAAIVRSTKRSTSAQLIRISLKFVTFCRSKSPADLLVLREKKQAVGGTYIKTKNRCGLNAFPRSVPELQSRWAGLLA